MTYDHSNVFAKILAGELPNNTVYEDDHVLSFHDIKPCTPVHVLVIPKKPYISFADFVVQETAEEVSYFFKKVNNIATDILGLKEGGFRIISNTHGNDIIQEVMHFHVHILGGKSLDSLV